ncbi:MAG: hypothetical protein ACLP9L_05305 [Thermoguttaceae bacterium]
MPAPGQWQWIASSADNGKQFGNSTRGTWEKLLGAIKNSENSVKPQLISDFTAYNTGDCDQSRFENISPSLIEQGYGLHWVGDLAIQFDLESKSAAGGKVVVELIKGGRHFQCRFDLSSGKAELAIGGGPEAGGYHRMATTAVVGAGTHSIIFANVDDELTLWVDRKVVAFSDRSKAEATAPQAGQTEPKSQKHPNQYNSALLDNHIPTVEDLSPLGTCAEAVSVKVSHIKVMRDVYYIAVFNDGQRSGRQGPLRDFTESDSDLNNPLGWGDHFQDSKMRTVEIQLKPADPSHPEKDQFFVLGDNSGQSSDDRLWIGQFWVERELLIGKALFIYWPHGWELPYLQLPSKPIPNLQRMCVVR